ncbi:hypothetical protein CSPX01_08528 [Colletotrichum filicis]|nr:hypothetical protein CSPX01_08528 [Colletotrichum filicis]
MKGKHEGREAMSGVFTARVASSDLKACRNARGSPITPSRGIAGCASVSKDWQDYFESLIFKNFILRLQDLSLSDMCRHGFAPLLKKFAILHETSSTPYCARVVYRGAKVEEIVDSVVQGFLLVEHLALGLVVDADDFLNNAPNFPKLKTLTLIAEMFPGDGESDEAIERRTNIKTLLSLAVLEACRMPKLDIMEIWNGQDGQVSISRYKVVGELSVITWTSTQDDVVVDDDIVTACEATARVHARDDMWISVIRLPDGLYTYHGSVLQHLESKEHFINGASAAQMT